MLDRILASANPDGMLYDEIRASDLQPLDRRLSDNWGYVYGSVYTHFMVTGEKRYRDAVVRVLQNLPRYRGHDWENGSHDGYADAIESALYLVAREPVPEAISWIESETRTLIDFQQADGTIERWYGDGNWNRTLLLYAMWKTQGCYVDGWKDGLKLGATRQGDRLFVSIEGPADWKGKLHFDYARHRRDAQLRTELRAAQRVARVVHGRREHALPGGGRRGARACAPRFGPEGRDRDRGPRAPGRGEGALSRSDAEGGEP